MAGCLLLLAGVVCIPLRRVARWERRRCKLHRPTTTPVGGRVMNPPDPQQLYSGSSHLANVVRNAL